MANVAVVVPWRGGCSHREAAWEWVQARYAEHHPGWEVIEAPAPGGAWSKGAAVNPMVKRCEAEVVIQADADVWCDGLERAVYAVICGQAEWAVPHLNVHRLGEAGTAAVLAGASWRAQDDLTQTPYPGILGGGFIVARRESLAAVPLDGRFEGWGQEDEAHAIALNALLGDPWRGQADLVHLYHPPQDRLTRRRGSQEGWALRSRYLQRRHRPDQMRKLLEEATCR